SLPTITKSQSAEGGRVRRIKNPDGATIVERLEAFDEIGRSYSYSIVQAPFPVTGYLSTLCVRETDDGTRTRVEWSGQFTPNGVSELEASRLFQSLYEDGLKALAAELRRL